MNTQLSFNKDILWTFDYAHYNPQNERHTETLTTLGNGYFGTRGSIEGSLSSQYHNPGTYIAGVYNRLISKVGNRNVDNEDMVCTPDWTYITFQTPKGDWFDIDTGTVLSYHKQLDLKTGLLHRKIRFQHPTNEISNIQITRFVSMANPHLAGIQYKIIPENYAGTIHFKSALNGDIENAGVERYSQLNQLHLKNVSEMVIDKTCFLEVETTESHIHILNGARHTIKKNMQEIDIELIVNKRARYIDVVIPVQCHSGDEIILEKIVGIFSDNSVFKDDDGYKVSEKLFMTSFSEGVKDSIQKWNEIWKEIDIKIDGDEHLQKVIRLHLFHLMITASHFNTEIDASIPARGLHGEAYRGHIFWDELFVFPIFNLHYPDISKALLMYRYRRLNKAREYAKQFGYEGAMFPWQSGSDGREETQTVHLNPISGKWGDDYSSLQRHVSLSIAYNAWQYFYFTNDIEWLKKYGAELILDIAKFWVSMCQYNQKTDRFEVHHVMGPNEFHEKMPNSTEKGLKDNAYTNILIVWLLNRTKDILQILDSETRQKLQKKLSLANSDFEKWDDIIHKMNLVVENEIISQYDGFLKLKEIDWTAYKEKYKNIGRLDRILKAEGLSPDDYQIAKQADLLMLFFLLSPDEIKNIVKQLGYMVTTKMLRKNFDYYLKRTTHGSTLSFIVHSYVAAILGDIDTSLQWYEQSLDADISDIQGGTTKEGIHVGLMAGTITNLLFAYVGLHFWNNMVSFSPHFPSKIRNMQFQFQFKKIKYFVKLNQSVLYIKSSDSVTIIVNNHDISLIANQEMKITL